MTIPKKVGCVGSGTIGSSWALLYALKGYDVLAYDIQDEAIAKSRAFIENIANTLVEYEIVKQNAAERALERIGTTTKIEDIASCDYVQESAIERMEVKVGLLDKLEEVVEDDVVIASSTSGLSITKMQKKMKHPERTVIAHPFNPPHLMPLVEIVRGAKTSDGTVGQVYALMETLGKVPVKINKQLPGFAANRLQTAVLRESLSMLADGVVDADGLEKIMNAGLGLRWAFMGPLVTASLAGGAGGLEYYLEHFGPLHRSVCETLNTSITVSKKTAKRALEETSRLPAMKSKSYPQLVKWRDENLIAILKERGYL